jgi:prolyl oligopeptidase
MVLSMDYPPAGRDDVVDELFGHRIADPYRWLEDPDDPRTREWLTAQDDLFAGELARLPGHDHWQRRITELTRCGEVDVPVWRGERQFVVQRRPEQEHPALLCREPDGTERVLIDPGVLDPTGRTTLDSWVPSNDGRLLAYQLSLGGTEESLLRVMDVATGRDVDGPIDRVRYSPLAWLPAGDGFYYVRRLPPDQVPTDETQYHRKVYLHMLGDPPAQDRLVFGDGLDKTNYYGVALDQTGRWLIVEASAGTAPRTDVWIADLSADGSFTPVQVGVDARTDAFVGRDGRLYLFTDREAPRGRLCVAEPTAPGYESWRDLLAEDDEAVLVGCAILDRASPGRLLAVRTKHAVSLVSVHDLRDGGHVADVDLPGLGSVAGISERFDGGREAWFGYTDFVTPTTIYRYDADEKALSLWERPPGVAEVPPVQSRQVVYPSRDGTPIRMFVLSAPDPARPAPTVLYGYGGFNVAQTPAFNATILAWVEAGGVYAVANLRGGSEEGEEWHRAGMRERKQNVFDDFLAAADWLVAEGWTSRDRLAVAGGSNGGLLVGAALTQRPDAFAAVLCSAPLLDMVRYESFGLGATWNDEFGTAAKPDELGWLLGYSPYHHVVEDTAYPAVLFTVFDGDTRVDPMHARKMCAALQAATSSDRPVLLRRETDVGHGARALSRAVDLAADISTFLAAETGLTLRARHRT